jgi:uncharacterized protein YlxW (UPF0749 family)
MTLLTSMMERPLDPAYATAAERRTAAGLPAATSTRTGTMLVAAMVVGLLLTLGALSLRRPDTALSQARADLVAQIEARRSDADTQARQVQALQAEIDRAQTSALGGEQAALATRLSQLSLATGSEAVTGPGLTITLDDARASADGSADGDPRSPAGSDEGRVLSKDLQLVVNGLWEAGAEAIAINGQRLTARSAIRFAGEAILVNYRPLTRPYTISAVGNPSGLEVEFADTAGGSYARALKDNYGIRVTIAPSKRLTIPAATSLTLRMATPPTATPSGPSTTPGGQTTPTDQTTPTTPSTPSAPTGQSSSADLTSTPSEPAQ